MFLKMERLPENVRCRLYVKTVEWTDIHLFTTIIFVFMAGA